MWGIHALMIDENILERLEKESKKDDRASMPLLGHPCPMDIANFRYVGMKLAIS